MRHSNGATSLEKFVWNFDFTLNVFIAYEDLAAGKRAKEACDTLAGNLGPGWRLAIEVVSFKMLETREWKDNAACEAARADILVVSCKGDQLPRSVEEWVGSWLARESQAMSLVALFGGQRRDAKKRRVTEDYLAAAARLGGMEFFSRGGTCAEEEAPLRFSLDGLAEGAVS